MTKTLSGSPLPIVLKFEEMILLIKYLYTAGSPKVVLQNLKPWNMNYERARDAG
jgi:hypothetical protein